MIEISGLRKMTLLIIKKNNISFWDVIIPWALNPRSWLNYTYILLLNYALYAKETSCQLISIV